MGCCCFRRKKVKASSSIDEAGPSEPPARASVSLGLDASAERVNSVDLPPPPVYYVIVGRGPAATVNNTTLQLSTDGKARIGELEVLHIGFRNPWPTYLEHGMGQPPYLLSLPGFKVQPNAGGREIDGGLHSRDFGRAVDDQLALLVEQTQSRQVEGWVAWVQIKANQGSLPDQEQFDKEMFGKELFAGLKTEVERVDQLNEWPDSANFRLFVVEGERDIGHYYAEKIDFCTGPGRPNVFGKQPALADARTAPWLAPEVWPEGLDERRVLNGVDAIVDEVRWVANERICVTAGGGVGLNGAEKARNHGCWLDWFGRRNLIATFGNPRNHTFLAHPKEARVLRRGELDELAPVGDERNVFPFIPPRWNLRFGKGAGLDDVATEKTHVKVLLKDNGKAAITDYSRAETPLDSGLWMCTKEYVRAASEAFDEDPGWPSERYDRLVIPNGQNTDALGQPSYFAELGEPQPLAVDGRMVGLQDNTGNVRLLGAAAQVYNGFGQGTWDQAGATPKDLLWSYHSTLPVSAVLDGFILSGSNIATANGYFKDFPNTNVNTMTRAEMLAALDGRDEIAEAIIDARQESNGYENYAALERAVNAKRDPETLTRADKLAIEAAVVFAYPNVDAL